MKRKILPLFLCTCLLLGGCTNQDESAPLSDNTPEIETTDAVTESAEESQTMEEITLFVPSDSQLAQATLEFTNSLLSEYMEGQSSRLGDYEFSVISERELSADDIPNVRMSTRKTALTGEERDSFLREVSDSEYIPLDKAAEDSAYWLFREQPWSFEVEKVMTDGSDITIEVSNARVGYKLTQTMTLRAFVSLNEDGAITFIPDPVYMYGIPVAAKDPQHLTFDLNGTEIMMDSFAVTDRWGYAETHPEVFEDRGTDFFYAKVNFTSLEMNYDFVSGYSCKADVYSVEPITDDVEAVLNKVFTIDDLDKDPEMAAVYNAIMNNIDTICKDSTHGITLLDLDFDGTPELLVSDVFERGTERYSNLGVNVSVYRIENEELKYIDSFTNAHIVVYDTFNSLGLKTLPDGTKGWFSTSCDDEDFVYQLKGDELTAVEILTKELVSVTVDEDYGYTTEEYDYYFMGELIVPTVIYEDISDIEGPASDTHLEWNGITSYWGEMWELVGFIRQDYCSDITETHCLYSDWLSPYADTTLYDPVERYSLTDRELSYNIANLVDSYYLGEYDPNKHTYSYRFLGDYAKPVIYLYPEEETEVTVRVELPEGGELTCTYPDYGDGWEVTALPDGTIYDKDGNEYYCLYWEGNGSAVLEGGEGWCVAGEDSAEFLRGKLLEIGLTAREANEFIIYWLPELQKSDYNVITFHTEDYAKSVPLTVSPAPDSVIRVFMTFEPSSEPVDIAPQTLPHYERSGFTLVEWGGSHA